MIIFEDETYIELITYKNQMARWLITGTGYISAWRNSNRSRLDVKQRFIKWFDKDFGPVDWCMRIENMEETLSTLADSDIRIFRPRAFKRTRLDGVEVKWQLGGVEDPDLPFLLCDETPFNVRVPNDASLRHANGATGIRCLKLKPRNHSQAVKRLSRLLGQAPISDQSGSRFDVGPNTIVLNYATNSTAGYVVELSHSGLEVKQLDINKSSGATIWLVPQRDTSNAKHSPCSNSD
jgi:hypothetical protein